MGSYGMGIANYHMVCFTCRISIKNSDSRSIYDIKLRNWIRIPRLCTRCGSEMVNMGKDFKAPKQRNIKQWRKVFLLHLLFNILNNKFLVEKRCSSK